MSEEASSAPEESAEQPGSEYEDDGPGEAAGGRGCLPVLIGVFLLLAGAFAGTQFAKRYPSVEKPDPTTEPIPVTGPSEAARVAAIAAADRPPVELHYLVVCGEAERVGPRVDLLGVVAELWPSTLPSKGGLTVALAISAANRDRRFAIRGSYADGSSFLEAEVPLDPDDPRRTHPIEIPVFVELTKPEALVFEVFTDDKFLVGRRIIAVRLRPATRPTTPSSTQPATGPAPGAAPGPSSDRSTEESTESLADAPNDSPAPPPAEPSPDASPKPAPSKK